jgi:hypothetical protein
VVAHGRRCYREPIRPRLVTLGLLALVLLAPSKAAAAERTGFDAYRGAGAWVDIYDDRAVPEPEAAVADMAAHGARTLYLETGNWRLRRNVDISRPDLVARYITAAHLSGMKVVAWYLPGLVDRRRDLRRVKAALQFTTIDGQRFDGFALDIEAQLVRSIPKRNNSLLRLSRSIRRTAGPDYALGAIVPDQVFASPGGAWPGFPWRRTAAIYDVFLPMSYSSVRVRAPEDVYAYTYLGAAFIRAHTGNPATPVHVIGGLADKLNSAAAASVVGAALDVGAVGVSFYKYRLSARSDWDALAAFAPPAPPPGP